MRSQSKLPRCCTSIRQGHLYKPNIEKAGQTVLWEVVFTKFLNSLSDVTLFYLWGLHYSHLSITYNALHFSHLWIAYNIFLLGLLNNGIISFWVIIVWSLTPWPNLIIQIIIFEKRAKSGTEKQLNLTLRLCQRQNDLDVAYLWVNFLRAFI